MNNKEIIKRRVEEVGLTYDDDTYPLMNNMLNDARTDELRKLKAELLEVHLLGDDNLLRYIKNKLEVKE